MGAIGISKTVETTDIKKVWNELSQNAADRYRSEDYCGYSGYSGDWNTISFGKIKKVLDKYSESKVKSYFNGDGKKLWNDIHKYDSITLDLGVTGYEVWSIKKLLPNDKKPPKYEQKFVVYHMGGEWGREEVMDATYKSATEANTKAMELTMEKDRPHHVKKARILVGGTEETASFTLDKKVYKSKPKSVKKGSVLKEIHKYHIMGMAAN